MFTEFLAWVFAGIIVITVVGIHYESMLVISDRLLPWAQHRLHGRVVMMLSIGALLVAHICEIWVYSFALMAVTSWIPSATISGDFHHTLNDYLYFSAVNYTSLGDNNIQPVGAVRSIIASETLAGMMMIAWSASFTYLKMENIWQRHRKT